MAQVSSKLRSVEGGFAHWCPGCGELHRIPTGGASGPQWTFDGNVHSPTFGPSVRIRGKLKVIVDGDWVGDWVRDAAGNAIDHCCHYFLRGGVIEFCGDSTHALAGQTVPLPDLPVFAQDRVTEELRDRLERQTP